MKESVSFLQMFSEYRPGEDLSGVLSVVRITGADLDPATRQAVVTLYADQYIPMRLLEKVERDICSLYGLRHFEIHMTHPAEELQKVEPEELMQLFVEENSMNRASRVEMGRRCPGNFPPGQRESRPGGGCPGSLSEIDGAVRKGPGI